MQRKQYLQYFGEEGDAIGDVGEYLGEDGDIWAGAMKMFSEFFERRKEILTS